MELIDLLYADRKNEELKAEKRWGGLAGIAGLALILCGYAVIFQGADTDFLQIMGIGGTIIGAGTLLFFFAAAGAVLNFLKKRKRFYYKKLNLFVVNQLGTRMKSIGISVAVVCILRYLSISIMGVGMGMGQSSIRNKDNLAPYDISVDYHYYGEDSDPDVIENGILNVLKKQHTQLAEHVENTAEITFYTVHNLRLADIFNKDIPVSNSILSILEDSTVSYIGIDDYNKLRKLAGKEIISLKQGEYAVNYNAPEAKKLWKLSASRKTLL